LIDSSSIAFPKGSIREHLLNWFIDRVNFCHGEFHDGTEKPANKLYDWLYYHWLWPFKQTDCVCCNTVRGLLYGIIIGYVIGRATW